MSRRNMLAIAFGLAGLLAAGPSQAATLIGSVVNETLYYPDLATLFASVTVIVGPGVEFPAGQIGGDSQFQTDVTANQIIYQPLANSKYSSAAFNGFVLTFTGAPVITGVTVDPSTNFPVTPFSFTANSVTFNVAGESVNPSDRLVFDLTLATAAPEPATWILLVAGFCGLGVMANRRNAKPAIDAA